MYSKHHFLISVAVAAAVVALTTTPYPWWLLFVVAAVVGVGIDFDHFLVAGINTGDWEAVRRCVRDPRIVFFDQGEIFEEGEVGVVRRLLSHVVLGGLLVGLLALLAPFLAAFVALILYFHLLADLVWDVWNESNGAGLNTDSSTSPARSSRPVRLPRPTRLAGPLGRLYRPG